MNKNILLGQAEYLALNDAQDDIRAQKGIPGEYKKVSMEKIKNETNRYFKLLSQK